MPGFGKPGDELRAAFATKLLAAFRRITPPSGQVLSFDATRWFEHYSFDPHRVAGAGRDQWALPTVPEGAFTIFTTPDFSSGLVGNPFERTLCVFGRALLDAVLADPPPGFAAMLRCDGQVLNPPHIVADSGSPP